MPSLVAALVAMQAVSARRHHHTTTTDCSTTTEPENSPTTYSTPEDGTPTTFSTSVYPVPSGHHGIPANVQAFYDKVQSAKSCSRNFDLASPFFASQDGPKDFCYCNEFMENKGFYIRGKGSDLAPMQIDCDGNLDGIDPRCRGSSDTQAQTAFRDEVKKFGIRDLRADIHPYVVLGNEGSASGFTTFDPRSVGVEPLSVVAVVCNGKLVFGVWGDTNGDDGPPLVGEASLALATACFGERVNGHSGHDQNDVLYIAFSGPDAVPGKSAKWKAKSYEEFEESITDLGNRLIASL
jgi:chitosanase